MTPDITDNHRWLHRFLGEWTVSSGEPGSEPFHTGTESVRPLGDAWILAESRGDIKDAGETFAMMTLGFDPASGRFVGSWVGNMMTHLWVYDGSLDADRQILTLESQGPSFTAKAGIDRYRDVHAIHGDDHRVLTALVLEPDGQWKQFMTSDYRRV